MSTTIIDYKKEYINWLNSIVDQEKINDTTFRFSLPFLDRHNDLIEIYLIEKENGYELTDDGSTLRDLKVSGFDLNSSENRKKIFQRIINSHGVSIDSNEALHVDCDRAELPIKKHLLAQCIQKVDDLFVLSRSSIRSIFIEDVQAYLDDKEIRYISDVSFTGKSKLNTNYDFVIPKSKDAPERMIKVVNNLTMDYAKSIMFGWNDIYGTRSFDSHLYTFIQDSEKSVSKEALNAFSEYEIIPVLWSNRDNYIEALAA